jgi:type II restriction/modification system DNA methylase subunit YeeA
MNPNILKPRKALNKAFLKVKPNRNDIEKFKFNLIKLVDQIDESESEEFHKNLVSDFLKNTYYGANHFINTKGRNDLVIHNSGDTKSTVGVIVEAKKPTNKAEMVKREYINTKAFQELVLYYLRERITQKNLEIKYLIATNIYEWFIFDAHLFEKEFAQNKTLIKQLTDFEEGRLSGKTTDFFYKEIAEPAIENIKHEVVFTHFDIRDYEKPLRNNDKKDDNVLIALFKLLSPEHLLKLPFTNDSNSLNKGFYTELLHIIGLTETKNGGKKLIERKKEGERNSGSLIESAIAQLESLDKISRLEKPSQYGETNQERLFNVALELCITWVNRILFLKLLEAQLVKYSKGDKLYNFLNLAKIQNFDDLNTLFFSVLARKYGERNAEVKKLFASVPYLNSSLFEPTSIEHSCLFISQLKDGKLPITPSTVIRDSNGKKRNGELVTLEYFFEFLNAYDFSSEGSEDIQEDNKTLINASVLGLIFEKINGYKDGSFFTPSFITMYMCRETIRRAIVQKFNEVKGWDCQSFDQLYDKIEDTKEANRIINSLKICDIAVGSGHFLVSALNEIIAIKGELKVLLDRKGKRLKEYHVEVENDELIVTDEDGEFFEYNPRSPESQRVQETLFHEKQTIIENCLFGVDINPNSVKICRLRLWIELLKNAYYNEPDFTELETLPNIDINIKCGNSLVSRYALDADIKTALKKSKWNIDSYRIAVMTYRNAKSKDEKRAMEKLIGEIKNDFESEIASNDKRLFKLNKSKGELLALTMQTTIYDRTKVEKIAWDNQIKSLNDVIKKLEVELEEIRNNKIYENAFEWRFEFPEVLNNDGNFVGFDVVVGNPPYFSLSKIKEQANYFESSGYNTYSKSSDIYCLFYERGVQLLKQKGLLTYITSNSWLRTQYGTSLRKYFLEKTNPLVLLNIEDKQVFEEATVESNIITIEKEKWARKLQAVSLKNDFKHNIPLQEYFIANHTIISDLPENGWALGNEMAVGLKMKIEQGSKPIKDMGYLINYGIKTGFNEAFFISTDIKEKLISEDENLKDLIKPVIRGKDVSRYNFQWNNIWIILIKQGWTNKNRENMDAENFFGSHYPSIYRFLKHTGDTIKGKGKGLYDREDQGDYWWELRPCAYYQDFEKEKIIWGELSDRQKFAFDNTGLYPNNTIFFITGKSLKYLLSILNSKLANWYFNEISTSSGMGTNRWLKYKIEQLPIKDISESEQKPFVDIVEQILANPNSDTTKLEYKIDQLVYKLYGLTEEEIKIVEGI